MRLICHARPRVYRFHIAVDLPDHRAQMRMFPGRALLLGLIPQFFVAGDATDFQVINAFMRDLGDFLVAFNAQAFAVHAVGKLFRDDVQIARLAIGPRHRKALVAVAAQT